FHFSFAEYRNPKNINFGVLRVLNDDIIHANSGFDTHPHSNMEIISYIVNGEITHKDSMGNEEVLKAGEVQYLSAGDGIYHSEHNKSNKDLRLLQIWIVPPEQSLPRLYGSYKYTPSQKENKLLKIVSSLEGDSKVRIYQDVNIYVSQLEKTKSLDFKIEKNRQVYFVQIEGSSFVNSLELKDSDAMQIVKEENLHIKAISNSHFLFIEMNEQ
ncbi:pirin family protein, partial [Poseidonibacter sp.]|uniref:pirin family protein n=1 Tax=Poseidonibacter sp. TaxID=2321188 RepID=UPI003C76C22D